MIRRLRNIQRSSILMIFTVGALAFPLGVLASHQFTDVPTGSTFHDDVEAVTDAGIASGTGGGLYKPSDPVTRGQMAAFLHRSIGRAAVAKLGDISTGGSQVLLGSASLNLIGPSGGNQGVLVQAAMQLDHDSGVAAGCSAALILKKGATTIDVWNVEFYADGAGHEEAIVATFYTTQPSGSSVNYDLYGTNSCDQTLFTDEDLMVVQNLPLAGDAGGVTPASISSLSVEGDREEDQ